MTKNTEQNLRKKRVNPYLFFLLVELLKFEAEVAGERLSAADIQEYAYQKKLDREKYPNTRFKRKSKKDKDSRDPEAVRIANAVKRCFLEPQSQEDLIPTLKQRDDLAQLISKLGEFNSWAEFENKFKDDFGAVSGERFRTTKYSDLPGVLKQDIASWVSLRIDSLKLKYSLSGRPEGKEYRNMLINTGKFAIRNTNADELILVEQLAEKAYGGGISINGSEVKKSWHKINPHIIYGNFNSFRILDGNVNLLPIKEECYLALKNNEKYETAITPDDLFTMHQKGMVKHVYIEGLACKNNTIFASFVHKFKPMLESICYIDNEELIICSIGGSDEGNKLMDGCGFSRDNDMISTDPATGKDYLFREIKWKELMAKLEHMWNRLE